MMLKRTISGDGSSDLKQHLNGLPTHGPSQHDGPRHRLLQALLLRGDHHCQSDRHACPHNNVGCPFASMQQKRSSIYCHQVHQCVNVSAKDVLCEDG